MVTNAHLWAVGFDDMIGADRARDAVVALGWGPGNNAKYIILLDVAVVVRHLDDSFVLDHKPFPVAANMAACTALGFLAGLVLAAPLSGTTMGMLLGTAGSAVGASVGIDDEFIRQIGALMKPGTSILFVLDEAVDMEVTLYAIRGLGGKVLKTNVDLQRAKMIQEALAAPPNPPRID